MNRIISRKLKGQDSYTRIFHLNQPLFNLNKNGEGEGCHLTWLSSIHKNATASYKDAWLLVLVLWSRSDKMKQYANSK